MKLTTSLHLICITVPFFLFVWNFYMCTLSVLDIIIPYIQRLLRDRTTVHTVAASYNVPLAHQWGYIHANFQWLPVIIVPI